MAWGGLWISNAIVWRCNRWVDEGFFLNRAEHVLSKHAAQKYSCSACVPLCKFFVLLRRTPGAAQAALSLSPARPAAADGAEPFACVARGCWALAAGRWALAAGRGGEASAEGEGEGEGEGCCGEPSGAAMERRPPPRGVHLQETGGGVVVAGVPLHNGHGDQLHAGAAHEDCAGQACAGAHVRLGMENRISSMCMFGCSKFGVDWCFDFFVGGIGI